MGQAKRRGTFAGRRAQALAARAPDRPQQPVAAPFGPHPRRTVTNPRWTALALFGCGSIVRPTLNPRTPMMK